MTPPLSLFVRMFSRLCLSSQGVDDSEWITARRVWAFDGIVIPADILDAIAGAFRSYVGNEDPEAVLCDDGSWLLTGWMPADEMADSLGSSFRNSAILKRWQDW